jgi:hypothetical protein
MNRAYIVLKMQQILEGFCTVVIGMCNRSTDGMSLHPYSYPGHTGCHISVAHMSIDYVRLRIVYGRSGIAPELLPFPL